MCSYYGIRTLAKSDTNLYFRADFADGKPSTKKEMIYEFVIWGDNISTGGSYFIEIRLQGNDSNILKPIISIRKIKDNKNTGVNWYEKGFFKAGDSFFEAKFPFTYFKKYVSKRAEYSAQVRSWRGGSLNQVYDDTENLLVSFF